MRLFNCSILAFLLFLLFPLHILGQQSNTVSVVYLKNGSIIRGTILEMIPDSVIKIQTSDQNIFTYKHSEITKIASERLTNGPASMYSNVPNSGPGFWPPAPGKAVIYFVSLNPLCPPYEFFHNDQYVGGIDKMHYMRYECDPGEQLLWSSSMTRDFLPALLKEGNTYIVIVDGAVGLKKSCSRLTPINVDDKVFTASVAMVNKTEPLITDVSKIIRKREKLKDFVDKNLNKYETEWKESKRYNQLTPEMAIPEEVLY